ncbi:uncharacterized protein LOC119370003 [Jatropha curcas]|uniref:uncharacterized protein LOC119370003 n=1 Tax=Jatropha curcas TaxID=180498 RepID=UPI001894754D|nr:uncharacterized protein LOC119370003 [Jatropha curcas]
MLAKIKFAISIRTNEKIAHIFYKNQVFGQGVMYWSSLLIRDDDNVEVIINNLHSFQGYRHAELYVEVEILTNKSLNLMHSPETQIGMGFGDMLDDDVGTSMQYTQFPMEDYHHQHMQNFSTILSLIQCRFPMSVYNGDEVGPNKPSKRALADHEPTFDDLVVNNNYMSCKDDDEDEDKDCDLFTLMVMMMM